MQQRTVKIVQVHAIFRRLDTVFVRLPVNNPPFDTPTGQHTTERLMVMFTPFRIICHVVWGTTEFGCQHDESFVQQTPAI